MKGGFLLSTITAFMADMTTIFTQVLVWISQSFQFVYDNPVLLLVLCLAISRIIMRMVRKWIPGL